MFFVSTLRLTHDIGYLPFHCMYYNNICALSTNNCACVMLAVQYSLYYALY